MSRMLLVFCSFLLLCNCSIEGLLPEGSLTIIVLDEEGKPMEGIDVGIGFEKNTGTGTVGIPVRGVTDATGKFTGKHNTLKVVQYRAYKDGYYESSGEYRFMSETAKKWQPWNPEIKVVLRKIVNPVPMYARGFDKELPAIDKDIGCDLIENDWVKPYGKGIHSDIIFHLKKRYVDDNDYSADLQVKFSGRNDGFIKYDLNIYNGSEFKLPRYAPVDGYAKQFERHVTRPPGRSLQDDRNDNVGYIFRVRSSTPSSVMYGKIQRDIGLRAGGKGTAGIDFTYYLNPDHTRNLEFDPKRNLFTDLKSFERVGL
jgi:hypothetical protein